MLACALAAAGCSGDDGGLPPPKHTSTTETAKTTIHDYSKVGLPPVDGVTTTTMLASGHSAIGGTVVGPKGKPLPDAVVRIERLVGTAVQTKEVRTDGKGHFLAEKIPGGRYRVRAYRAPHLAMPTAEVFYLNDGDAHQLSFRLDLFDGIGLDAAAAPSDPRPGKPVNVAVRVFTRAVREDGVVVPNPVVGETVEIVSSRWPLAPDGQAVEVTNTNGVALFALQCERAGAADIAVRVGASSEIHTLDLPNCTKPPPPPTTTTTTTKKSSTTTTTTTKKTTSTSSSTTSTTT